MTKLEELKKEATDLGITYSPNIGEAKLEAKIEEYYKSDETNSDTIKKEIEKKEATKVKVKTNTLRNRANEAERKARIPHIVTIVDNDQRENNVTTMVSVTCGNDWFDLGLVRIPLNEPVEVMQGHLNVLKEIKIPMHSIDRKSGLTRTTLRQRYSIDYQDELKK